MNEALAGQALRTLGVAGLYLPPDVLSEYAASPDSRVEQGLVFAGLIGMIDPPRPEAKDAVARAKGAGIRPLMITGDHPRTAGVIAQELGISEDGRALTGGELEKLSEAQRTRTVAEVSVYARVNPEHKLRIVEALRRTGAVVAMTGDGVNDAPALKKADIGIAMGITGTDVSKEAADMVLADDNFASIVAAVEEGRAIFSNIRKFLRYLLSSNIGEVLTMFFGVLLAERVGLYVEGGGLVLPLLATQILWINLVTDGLPALALGVDPPDHGLMHQPPRPAGEGVLTPRMWRGIVFVGVIMAAGTLFVTRRVTAGGLRRGFRRLALRTDHGLYGTSALSNVQRAQRPFRRTKCVRPSVHQPMALDGARRITRAPGRGYLRAISPARIRNRQLETPGLDVLYRDCEFSAVAPGDQQVHHASRSPRLKSGPPVSRTLLPQ